MPISGLKAQFIPKSKIHILYLSPEVLCIHLDCVGEMLSFGNTSGRDVCLLLNVTRWH